ncbi:transcriptional regulator BetI [Aquimixticola soesokkakensis]|uniref:Transcriptional regulator BetI n=1 Tax=Aquimixticola soesokkakensis TaxID=1519096 RepID=A0A1Y5T275_9RHOB|nr:TetR/AcrR family transcriptional regulator [Aquimixticola soesokkakensis]SLN52345.1 transcriptional regulator BetI [Aquimixticola soesokkakensis]
MPSAPISPRKTPRQARARATVAAIEEAAAHILTHGGVDALTTNLVAARAGVSIGSLYQYFPTKEAILAELLRKLRREHLHDLERAAQQGGDDLRSTTTRMIRASIAHHTEAPELARALEAAESHLPLDAESEALKTQISAIWTATLSTHALPDPSQAAFDLAALTHGMVTRAVQAGERDWDNLAARVTRAALGYLHLCTQDDHQPTQQP